MGKDRAATVYPAKGKQGSANNEVVSQTQPEEIYGILTKDAFNELANFQGAPCVSILLPTHKAGVEVNEHADLIAFKNALQSVEKQLAERKTDQALVKKILEPGHALLRDEAFWRNLSNGLAVYISDNYFKYLKLSGPVSQHTRINSAFYVSPLTPFMVKMEYFYILDIAKKFPRFYRADAFGIERLQIEEMPTGIVNINDTSNYWELHIPFGGMSGKDSGTGRVGGRHALTATCDLKTATFSVK